MPLASSHGLFRCLGALALALTSAACPPPPTSSPTPAPALSSLADPSIGSGGFGFGYGGAFVGAAVPHGLAKAGPDTSGDFGEVRFVHTSGSWSEDETIVAISHLHLHGAGITGGGVVAMMPTTSFDPARVRAGDYAATRTDELTAPGRYRVHLAEPDVDVDLASTVHGTSWQLAFPDDSEHAVVVLDFERVLIDGEVTAHAHQVTGRRVTGSLHTDGGLSPPGGYDVFFVIEADDTADTDAVVITDTDVGVAFDFGRRGRAQPVGIKVALSLTDAEGAVRNFDAELAGRRHDDIVTEAQGAWSLILDRVRVFGGASSDHVIFASALYRSFLMPTVIADVDGRWLGPDGLHDDDSFRMMSDFSLWDTYRTVHPLYALMAPSSARDAALSIAAWSLALGNGPLWTAAGGDARVMVGSPGEVVLGDAVARDVVSASAGNADAALVRAAYDVLKAAASDGPDPDQGRGGRGDAIKYEAMGGYVPAPSRGAASTTFEYAVADQALAELARKVGDDATATHLEARSQGWRQLYDDETGFVRAKDDTGAFVIAAADFFPEEYSADYVEANAWHTMFPIDDVDGVIDVYGAGDVAAANARLSDLFERSVDDFAGRDVFAESFGVEPLPFHWQGNEPSLHVSWLPYRLGDDVLGQQFVDWVMRSHYHDDVRGIPGNDDGGALSAWYVEAALGLLPVAGDATWIIGAPLFPAVEVDTAIGTLRVERGSSMSSSSPQRLRRRLDGEDVDVEIEHAALVAADLLLVR